MDERVADERTAPSADDESKVYRDLRRRNERRADLARALLAERRRRAELLMAGARERKLNRAG